MSDQLTDLLAFVGESCTPFHAVSAMARRLSLAGFAELEAVDAARLEAGRGYYLTRNDSSIIAFRAGEGPVEDGLRLIGAHTDSPNLSVKPNPIKNRSGVTQLAVDVYGGALLNPWFDRDLSLAGRVSLVDGSGLLQSRLVNFERPVAFIPSLAIHLDRDANLGRAVNPQKDILPIILLSDSQHVPDFHSMLTAQLAQQHPELTDARVLDFEVSLYDTQPPSLVGLREEFIAAARLDNLLSCHTGLKALIDADSSHWSMLVCNDHEEVGSASTVGAQGPMLMDVLDALAGDGAAARRLREASVMLSVDNAHAIHPNFSDRHDENHGPLLNGGPVIKINRNQRYATSGEGAALVRLIAERCDVPVQAFVVRTDLGCGSTIGPLTAKETGINTIDLGVPTLGMHSIRELAGSADPAHLHRLLTAYLNHIA